LFDVINIEVIADSNTLCMLWTAKNGSRYIHTVIKHINVPLMIDYMMHSYQCMYMINSTVAYVMYADNYYLTNAL